MSETAEGRIEDRDLPGNDLDPKTPAPDETRKVSLVARVYGLLCFLDGLVMLPSLILVFAMFGWALKERPDIVSVGDPTLTLILTVINAVVVAVNAGCLIFFGRSLLKSRRRNAARWSHVLIGLTVTQLILSVMLQGVGGHLIQPLVQLGILLALSVTVDPTLRDERRLERRLRDERDRDAAEHGMLGRDLEGKGYIELNFFNLFWVFVVCCVLGLVIEVVYHMVIVDPGVYQDRAGMLFGPFSPIYGFGALLMTVALNRFYKASPVVIFLVSAVIGGLFEAAVSWFMQVGFGAVAWDYTGMSLFGIPDPVAVVFQGRTATPFMAMWGALGLAWIRLCLPRLLKLINLIPWKLRYSLTTLCAVLMLVNGVMTLEALDCWFERLSNIPASSPVEEFYAEHFDDAYMAHRFQSMTITPEHSGRVDTSSVA